MLKKKKGGNGESLKNWLVVFLFGFPNKTCGVPILPNGSVRSGSPERNGLLGEWLTPTQTASAEVILATKTSLLFSRYVPFLWMSFERISLSETETRHMRLLDCVDFLLQNEILETTSLLNLGAM